MIQYYPPQLSIPRLNGIIARDADLFRRLDPSGLEPVYFTDEVEEQRLADVASLKARGKGKPKKATTQGELRLVFCPKVRMILMRHCICRGQSESEEEGWREEEVDGCWGCLVIILTSLLVTILAFIDPDCTTTPLLMTHHHSFIALS